MKQNVKNLGLTAFLLMFVMTKGFSQVQDVEEAQSLLVGQWILDIETTKALELCESEEKADLLQFFEQGGEIIFDFRADGSYSILAENKDRDREGSWTLEKKVFSEQEIAEINNPYLQNTPIIEQGFAILILNEAGSAVVIAQLDANTLVLWEDCGVAFRRQE